VRPVLIAYLVVLLVMMFLEEKLIFFPDKAVGNLPHPPGLAIEDAWFQAADGTRLHGWYAPHSHPRAIVVYCHGNAGNISHRDEIIWKLHDVSGVAVLVFDYRGYGLSEGKPSEAGVLGDARAARAWLAAREGIAETDIVLMGESLGGAVAVDMAAADGAKALILESTFNSLPDLAARLYPWLPVRWLMRTRFDSQAKIGNYHGPLLQSHGPADSIVPFEFGWRLFEAANEPKQFLEIADRDHNDGRPTSYYRALAEFLDGNVPQSGR
jgi:fermentation-respiration switch protein FrsA (DUF1100 family)